MNNNEDYLKTCDLTLASLLSLTFPIVSLDRSNPPRVTFIFSRTPALDNLVQRFWRKELSIEPQAFTNQVKNLKNRIYSGE